MSRYLPNMVTIHVGTLPLPVKVRPGTAEEAVLYSNYRRRDHAEEADSGEACSCTHANSTYERIFAVTKKKTLPAFTDSRAIVVEKIVRTRKGIYGIGIIFEHKLGALQTTFDTQKNKFLRSEEVEGPVTLYAYTAHLRARNGKVRSSGKTRTGSGRRPIDLDRPAMHRGSMRRAVRAGLITPGGKVREPANA